MTNKEILDFLKKEKVLYKIIEFEEKKYHIDGKPASASDIISMAKECSEDYKNDWVHATSVGADVLRKCGHSVGYLEDLKQATTNKLSQQREKGNQ